jgi:hypothetical protein
VTHKCPDPGCAKEVDSSMPDITDAELALIREELTAGLPIPDASEPADVAIWRAEHAAELRETEAEAELEAGL